MNFTNLIIFEEKIAVYFETRVKHPVRLVSKIQGAVSINVAASRDYSNGSAFKFNRLSTTKYCLNLLNSACFFSILNSAISCKPKILVLKA